MQAFPSLSIEWLLGLAVVLGLATLILVALLFFRKRPPRSRVLRVRRREVGISARWKALYELMQTMMSTLNYQRVLDLSQDVAIKALSPSEARPEPLVTAVLLFREDRDLHIASARRLPPRDWRATFPARAGALAKVVQQRTPFGGQNPHQDPELRQLVALHGCRSFFLYPLVTGHDVYGVMLFAHPDPQFFTRARREVLTFIGSQAVIALENARLYHELEREKQRLAHIEEDARKKLARDLHDGPTQTIAAIAMRINLARRMLERSPEAVAEELEKIEALARRTTQEIRHMLFTLRPLVLENEGLEAALHALAEKMRDTYDQEVIVEVEPHAAERLDSDEQTVVFYITEEAVNNARKHAEAAHVWVRLRLLKDNFALLEIEDDGKGFDVDAVLQNYESRGSFGLINLQERAELVRGVVELDSRPGEGTRVRLWIPLNDDAAALLRQGLRPA